MPRVTQYIRDEDFPAWQELKNKSEFIHLALNSPLITGLPNPKNPYKKSIIKTTEATNLCEHFQVKGECLYKGCKYS